MDIYLGFDPGGDKRFGWAVCSSKAGTLHVRSTGEASSAGEAVEAVKELLSHISKPRPVVGAGIDAPLFWAENGGPRDVDETVRCAVKKLGGPSSGNTVQQINSLMGACLVQGVLMANLLHGLYPKIAITETHPKALLYLLGIASKEKPPKSVSLADLAEYVSFDKGRVSEHERDAILGAVAAFAQTEKRQGWKDLFKKEKSPVTPFTYPVAYWMPWHLVKQSNDT